MEFVCIKTCFWDTLIKENLKEVAFKGNIEDIPISVRPYFKSKTEVEAGAEVSEEIEGADEVDEVAGLQSELDALNVAYDRRWGAKKLKFALSQAKKGMT